MVGERGEKDGKWTLDNWGTTPMSTMTGYSDRLYYDTILYHGKVPPTGPRILLNSLNGGVPHCHTSHCSPFLLPYPLPPRPQRPPSIINPIGAPPPNGPSGLFKTTRNPLQVSRGCLLPGSVLCSGNHPTKVSALISNGATRSTPLAVLISTGSPLRAVHRAFQRSYGLHLSVLGRSHLPTQITSANLLNLQHYLTPLPPPPPSESPSLPPPPPSDDPP